MRGRQSQPTTAQTNPLVKMKEPDRMLRETIATPMTGDWYQEEDVLQRSHNNHRQHQQRNQSRQLDKQHRTNRRKHDR